MDGSGNLTAVNDFGADGLWARHDLTDEWFYTFDPQGSLSQKISRTGAVMCSAIFDAQGGQALSSPQPNDPYAGFGGQWGGRTDWQASYPDSLVLCGHRFYDFNSGRFLTRNPAAMPPLPHSFTHRHRLPFPSRPPGPFQVCQCRGSCRPPPRASPPPGRKNH